MAQKQMLKTTHHVYYKEDLVAHGSTCEVYKGYNKLTGEVRALKILNIQYHKNLSVSFQRETEALLQLQHPNIVTFYSVERENLRGNQVLVTEFCSGGSLSNFLREPENYNGLSDEEFLIFFHDIVCGMKHLRKNGFVHRDIKPPNILRCQNERKTVYKLTDFGCAKPLQDEEEFMSLVGTEEYLHPDIYQAVFFERSKQSFTASADLWSLGATLYHSATGIPPFIPYGGRENRIDMLQMLTNKQSGVVSGVQKRPGGDIEWSNDLPETAAMSQELKSLILPVIAGLLEKAPQKMWTFEKFFRHADEVNNKILIKVVDTIKVEIFHLYLEPTDCFSEVQKKLETYCDVELKDQRLLYEGQLLSESLKPNDPITKSSTVSFPKPIILISNQPINITSALHEDAEEIPEFGPSSNDDLRIAASLCEIACNYIREAKVTNLIMKHICKSAKHLKLYQSTLLDQRTTLLTGKKEWFFGILTATGLDELSGRIIEEEELDSFINIKFKTDKDMEKASQLVHKIKKKIEVCDNHANDLQKMCIVSTEFQECLYSRDNCFYENRCCNILSDLMDIAKEVMSSLIASKQRGGYASSYSKSQFNDIQKKRLSKCVQDIISHTTKHCFLINEKIFKLFNEYHKDYLETDRQLGEMYEEIKNLTENIQELNSCLTNPFMRGYTNMDSQKGAKKLEKQERRRKLLKALQEIQEDELDSEQLKKEASEISERFAELQFPAPYIPEAVVSDSEIN
ncbi:inhibitor of nuclear factor kappa-B kinase subunit epsilon isoform X2 [Octopus bimaculoides]|uniref:Protein kinase domain-containing protein n=1 Tax=Octopus bimaculoides TaxID=37653 RepID=A0A0L8I6V1_OCTBM|nr:inhibitor of nuclear factor kappa-B kinase subunit epsilon isoform X2 [Octopus bimaculoides]|eukprot:XP_014790093.1 PREDICTED: inhibitor of nuclear factor kappa-B kinase subunit epsilon-like isoform X2 [Octopus bimaculoides]